MSLIFIDESGDPGMLNKNNSSKYFLLCFVIFKDFLAAEEVSVQIKKLRRKRFGNDTQEFHFTKDSNATRKLFFEAIRSYTYEVKVFVVDKHNLNKDVFKINEKFYEYFLFEAAKEFAKDLHDSKLHLDGESDVLYKRKLFTSINNITKSQNFKIKSFKFVDSKDDTLIQLADMFAGIVRKNLDNPNKDIADIFKIVKNKVEIVNYKNK